MLKEILFAEGLLACLAFSATAGVHVTRFDPPLAISAFADIVPDSQPFNVLPVDFNLDDNVDFRLAYGLGAMGAYFNAPTRFAYRTPAPPRPGQPFSSANFVIEVGPVGAVPLGSVIGNRIVSSVRTSYFAWSEGFTNDYDLTRPFGDHQASVIIANVVPAAPYSSTGAILTTNLIGPPYFPVASGDVVGKEGVIALDFYINGQPHYGYIQFDFRSNGAPLSGAGGVIYGWAYETEPGVPIIAMPIGDEREQRREGHQSYWPPSASRR